jgi:transcriptional regulator with XRE-family HTH domain
MERTGTGESISGRQLARDVGIPSSTIDGLLSGATRTQPADIAQAIADRLGVALLVLWVPRAQAIVVDGRIPAASAAS